MILKDLLFRDYYHKYVVIEADTLTDELKGKVSINEHDCYVLCSSYVQKDGVLGFNVLSVGPAWNLCLKGLKNREMLGVFQPEQVGLMNSMVVQEDLIMAQKNDPWIEREEAWAGTRLLETRKEKSLDHIRNTISPDVVKAGILTTRGIKEYDMRITGFNGPFLEGRLRDNINVKGYYQNELLRTLPYSVGDTQRLLTVFSGDILSSEDQKSFDQLIIDGNKSGFGFARCGKHLKN